MFNFSPFFSSLFLGRRQYQIHTKTKSERWKINTENRIYSVTIICHLPFASGLAPMHHFQQAKEIILNWKIHKRILGWTIIGRKNSKKINILRAWSSLHCWLLATVAIVLTWNADECKEKATEKASQSKNRNSTNAFLFVLHWFALTRTFSHLFLSFCAWSFLNQKWLEIENASNNSYKNLCVPMCLCVYIFVLSFHCSRTNDFVCIKIFSIHQWRNTRPTAMDSVCLLEQKEFTFCEKDRWTEVWHIFSKSNQFDKTKIEFQSE